MEHYQPLHSNRCLICSRPGRSLCSVHEQLYVLDAENGWVRKKLRLQRETRRRENKVRYHNTEKKLYQILRLIFDQSEVVSSVHPLWAFSKKGVLLEYDIGIADKRLLIEYNGIQHYEYPNFFHKTRASFNEQVERDELKKDLAKINGWKLLIIKYNEEVTYGNIYRKLQREELSNV